MKITNIHAIEILDSRGNPTIRTFVTLEDGTTASSSVPSGASTGTYETVELRDHDEKRYNGKGVLQAVKHVNETIFHVLINRDVEDLKSLDQLMLQLDGTENKSRLGANAILSVSQAILRAASTSRKIPLWKLINEIYFPTIMPSFPRLMVNIVNGGKHANWAFDIQEFMIVPISTQPSQSIRTAAEIFHSLGGLIKEKKLSTLVGDEGGYAPAFSSNDEVFQAIISAAHAVGYENAKDFQLGIDAAASEFFDNGKYVLKKTGEIVDGAHLIEIYKKLREKYQIYSFEDVFDEDDWDSFSRFTQEVVPPSQVVGDDLLVTNPKRIQTGIDKKAANAIIIKVNQIGTVSEAVEAINLARSAGWKIAVSHRSGETEDPFIADFTYGSGADFIKTGSMSRSERIAKYNRLLEIENHI